MLALLLLCSVSLRIFFLCCGERIWVVWVVLSKFVYLFGCVMNSEKLIMDEENRNKTDGREGVCKLFYQHYYDLLRHWKVVKVGQNNYFLVPNNRSIQVGPHCLTTCRKKRWQEVKITGRPGNKHHMQIEKSKVSETLFIYENIRSRTNF